MSDELPVAEAPEAPVEAPEPVAPVDPEVAEAEALEAHAIEVPEGDGIVKLVPLSAVTKAREEAKQLRGEAKRAGELEQQLAKAMADLDASRPFVEAAKTMLQAPQQQPQGPQGPTAEETAELEEVARDLDFYKDGALDLERAGRHQARVMKAAQKMAAAQMAPLQRDAVVAKAQQVFAEVKAWKDPVNGEVADPEVMRELWNRVANQPNGLQTLANKDAVRFIWGEALNLTRWRRGTAPAPQAAPVAPPPPGPPVFTEHSGGATQPVTLSSMERRVAKDMGMSEAEYLKAAAKVPRGM